MTATRIRDVFYIDSSTTLGNVNILFLSYCDLVLPLSLRLFLPSIGDLQQIDKLGPALGYLIR